MSKQSAEIFMPPNLLKAKLGGTITGLDMTAVKRAEAAMETLKSEFSDWIAKDITRLGEAYNAFRDACNDYTVDDLFRAAHDLKGQATTFEYPLIARIAASLCKLIDELKSPDAVAAPLVEAHVNAMRVVFRDQIKTTSNVTALTLVEELEAHVREALERHGHS